MKQILPSGYRGAGLLLQALPLGPTRYANSPYQGMSSFAGNWLVISQDALIEDGLSAASDCESRSFPAEFVDYDAVTTFKRSQRLLWASTGTKDPKASDTLYIQALAAPFTVNRMPEATLNAFGDHGTLGETLQADGDDSEEMLAQFAKADIDTDVLAGQLQDEGAKSFVKSWEDLMNVIAAKSAELNKAS